MLSSNREARISRKTIRRIVVFSQSDLGAHIEIFSESCYSILNLDCNYHFPIDLAANGIQFGAESIGIW